MNKDEASCIDVPHRQNSDHDKKQKMKVGADENESESCRKELFSGISFSKFENMSDYNQNDDNTNLSEDRKKPELKTYIMNKKSILKRIPSSNKIISSKQIKEEPIQIKQIPKKSVVFPVFRLSYESDETVFEYCFSNEIELSQKVKEFVEKKQMMCQLRQNCITAIQKAPFYSNVLKICFPTSGLFADQVYQIQFDDKRGKIVKISGQDEQYSNFKEELLTELWIQKCLLCKSLKQKIKYFLVYANQPISMSNQKKKLKGKGGIDSLRINVEKLIKRQSDRFKRQERCEGRDRKVENSEEGGRWEQFIGEGIGELIQKLRQAEKNLKGLLQEQLRKQQLVKSRALKNVRKQNQEMDRLSNSIDKNEERMEVQPQKLLVTPVIQKILMDQFYEKLSLQQIVVKLCPYAKNMTDFQQKKMIIKGSLNRLQILKHIQLPQFLKTNDKSFVNNQEILTESIKILQTIKVDNYPFPPHIFNIVAIFQSTLLKQISSFSKPGNMKVKFQDHLNDEQTILQFTIYCVLMCENRNLYSTVLTCLIFYKLEDVNPQLIRQQSLRILNTLKKAIEFIERDWIL